MAISFSRKKMDNRRRPIGRMEDDVQHSRAPHFFKIILHDAIRSGKLMIPKKFARKYRGDLSMSDVVLLRVPTGDTWDVELRRGDDGAFWLQKGWLDFANFYSIRYGHFLVFQYVPGRSSSMFNVTVFDKSATEVEYPVKSPVKVEDIDEEDQSSEEPIRDSHTSCQKARSRKQDSLQGKERAKALERAKSFKSSNPYLAVVMQPSYVYSSYTLTVPGSFLQQYAGRKKFGEVPLHVSNSSKVWNARYNVREARSQVKGRMYGGWKAFVVDNNLVVGDVCVFELMRGLKTVSFKITIFRAPPRALNPGNFNLQAPENGTTRPKHKECSRDESEDGEKNYSSYMTKDKGKQKISRGFELRAAGGSGSKHPFFQAVITQGCLSHRCLNVPTGFVREYIDMGHREHMVTLKIEDRAWRVKLILRSYPQSNAQFSGGLGIFLKENSLKAGDLCTFELIQREEMVLRVSISRDRKRGTLPSPEEPSRKSSPMEITREMSPPVEELMQCLDKDGVIHSCFQIVLTKRHLQNKYLVVPDWFTSNHLESRPQTMGLQVGERTWEVTLYVYPDHSRLSQGWVDFQKDNNLKAGDVCFFELIHGGSHAGILLKVTVHSNLE